jgi:hypothetical protein
MSAGAAGALVSTAAERAALEALRAACGGADTPLERHGVRLYRICLELAAGRGIEIDAEVLVCAALLHDIGLAPTVTFGGPYVTDGCVFAGRLLEPLGWEARRLALCLEAIERHHELRSQWPRGAEVELLRRADMIDLSAGAIAFGLDRAWLRRLAAAVPRDGLYRELAPLIARRLRAQPRQMLRIFTAAGRAG